MRELKRTTKRANFKTPCLYDEMYKSSIKFLSTKTGIYKFKNELHLLLDEHLRTSGICNPPIHLGKETQTAKTYVNKAITQGYFTFE